ncbi:hypothetical protein AWJ14_09215 [Hoeflea olei]|uniref:Diguanylate cyclase n=1 Tax=Hoeflea olei TaxID=1480615 RepID=A0A1C1Z0D0_9HYPH|nr:hypothetical protein AWJ14_09215 [Hoeflea olei]
MEFKFTAILLVLSSLLILTEFVSSAVRSGAGVHGMRTEHVVIAIAALCIIALGVAVLALRYQVKSLRKRHRLVLVQSERDLLTGVVNRETFLSEAQTVLGKRAASGQVALLLVDIDHFKQVNDTYGHLTGDEVLVFFANQLRQHFRDARVGRLGGDEFCVLIEHTDPITPGFLHRCCGQFLDGLKKGVAVTSCRLSVSASIGIALAPVHGKTWSALVANADMALYASKRRGRACSTLFDEDMMSDMRNEKALVRELRAALLLQHLRVAYQPILGSNGELMAYEALLRWPHALRGYISPDVFIPVAERAGLIADVGYYVLRQVCTEMSRLQPVPVNINLSASQIALPDLLDRMLEILDETGTDPSRIVIEITESASLAANEVVAGHLRAIQNRGFRIALDDFGMGYSEFNQLRALPFDVIKIDKSYICALGTDMVTDVFVNAVVEIARRLGKVVVAEGIETEDDRLRAGAAGCHRFQGYYFAKPAFVEEIDRAGACGAAGRLIG